MEKYDSTVEEDLKKMIREKLKQYFSSIKPDPSVRNEYNDIELLIILIIITCLLHSARPVARRKKYYYRKAVYKNHQKNHN